MWSPSPSVLALEKAMHDHAPSGQPGQNDTNIPRREGWTRSKRRKWRSTRGASSRARQRLGGPQNSSLRAFAGKALTMVLAGFAFTITIFPKISRFPALVAFFWRVLMATTPGMTNFPFFLAPCVAMLARVLKAVLITPLFTSQLSASAAVRALLVMTVDFIIGAISAVWARKTH